MGTGKNYSPSSPYGAASSSSSRGYTPSSSRPSYTRTSSYEPPKYRSSTSVSDTIKKFGDNKYGSSSGYGADRYQSTTDSSRYPSLDRYGSRTGGYTSDYGGGSPYGSWDRASTRSSNSRYGAGSREGSPVSTRSSRYDYSSSASGPYSTYSSYKSGSDASPVPKPAARAYERQSSRGYENSSSAGKDYSTKRRTSVGSGGGGGGGGEGSAGRGPSLPIPRREESKRGKRGVSVVSSESDDSAPEAEKRDQSVKFMICRGTSPVPEGEPKEARVKDKSSVSRTRRIKVPDKSPGRSERVTGKKSGGGVGERGTVDCATQTNLDQPQTRRQRTSSNSSFAPASKQPGETFYKYRDKVLGGPAPTGHGYSSPPYSKSTAPTSRTSSRSTPKDDSRRSYVEDGVNTSPNERSWRQSVYGDPPPPPTRARREDIMDEDETSEADDRSSRHGRRRREGGGGTPRTSTPSTLRDRDGEEDKRSSRKSKTSRSSSREDMLDDRPRRKRHSSKDFLDDPEGEDKPPLTPETLSLRDSIEKVNQWKQKLPPAPDPLSPEGRHAKRHPGVGAESRAEYEDHPRGNRMSRQYSQREESPTYSRDNSPSRRSRNRASRHASRQGSNDSILDDDDDRDPRLPNKDFRKSELNKADHYYNDADTFEREMSPTEVRRRPRRSDSHEQHGTGAPRVRKSGSSSETFSRDDSPTRHRHSNVARQASDDHRRLSRDGSRDSLLDDRRRSRREQHDTEISDSNGSQFGFNREDSPNRRNSKHLRHSRQNSREDVLDDRGHNSSRQRPAQLGVAGDEDGGKYRMSQSMSQQSLTSQTSLPDIVPSPGGEWSAHPDQPQQQQQPQMKTARNPYQRQKSGMIGEVDDIDSVLKAKLPPPRNNPNIMDEPVPHTSHYPLKPAPASPLSPSYDSGEARKTRPNSYAFEQNGRRNGGSGSSSNLRQSKSHGDKLIDIEDETIEAQRAGVLQAPPPPRNQGQGKRGPRQQSATAQQMWGILQAKKGLVTITDFVSLCEKPALQRKLITVPGAEDSDQHFHGYKSADELLENVGVDVRKVSV